MTFTAAFICYHLIFIVSIFYSVFAKLLHCEKRKMHLTVFQVCWEVSKLFLLSSNEDQNLQSLKHSLKPCKYLETSSLHIYSSFYFIHYSKTQLSYKCHKYPICFSLTGENCAQIKNQRFSWFHVQEPARFHQDLQNHRSRQWKEDKALEKHVLKS